MSYTTRQVIEAGLRGYLEGCGGPHAGTKANPDSEQNYCVQETEDRALARCCAIDGFYDIVGLIMPWYRGEIFWAVGRKLCGNYVAALGESLRETPFEPSTQDSSNRSAGHPYFVPATVAAAVIGIELNSLQRRKVRNQIAPECYMSKGQRLWIRSDYVYAEREKKSKKVAA